MLGTIKAKFIVGFFVIFLLSFLVLNQTVKEIIWSNNKKIVTSDLIELKNNSSVYVRQSFLINHFTNNKLYFGEMAEEMVYDLAYSTGSNVSVYNLDGSLLFSSNKKNFSGKAKDDLQQAIKGKTAYHITYDKNKAEVLFSYPVVIEGSKVGILRFSKDFSLLFNQSKKILDIIFYIALAIFAVAFLFSYFLSRHITIPLVKLTQVSNEVIEGNLDVNIHFRRKDEIGKLAVNFSEMIHRINSQITTIERDRDRLKELNEKEKRFFDNITHELKTPLTSILGYAEIINKKGESDRKFFEKGMNHIIEESRRLHSMVVKLLEVSRGTTKDYPFKKINVSSILKDVCESMSFRAERYAKSIECEVNENLYIFGQSNRIRQLFINLLDNAIKYSSPHSQIEVKAEVIGEKVCFMFKNPSDPIEHDQYANLFQPFYSINREKAEEGSVGLGLSIAKSIIEDHGGIIRIFNEKHHTIVIVEMTCIKGENLS
ncbi:HAMP domain-containing sensor histidine kinase [Heyndrickxia sp. FSL K6-6286]|uniref:HAMP domain-containing sensor histidine kinase n=1 Tax=Heyndrickxia TaxID=2837504 RepID=UPI001C0EEB86|nr:HAMP domain-containing sensor histidine kinase [Heyndrickxia oleronia]MBU5210841.1 HAMP domain-containing histidine kinase [Heyndrickxia oleronia]